MFKTLKNKLGTIAASSILNAYDTDELDAGKRFISILAGVYMLQRGIRVFSKNPLTGIQEALLAGMLLYNGAKGINKKITKKVTNPSEVRRNQIQGNDPDCPVPAFV